MLGPIFSKQMPLSVDLSCAIDSEDLPSPNVRLASRRKFRRLLKNAPAAE